MFVFETRLCDNKRDCPDGGDEGEIKTCEQVQEFTPNGCCANVIFTLGAQQVECNYQGKRNLFMICKLLDYNSIMIVNFLKDRRLARPAERTFSFVK